MTRADDPPGITRPPRRITTYRPPASWWQTYAMLRRPAAVCRRLNAHDPAIWKLSLGVFDGLLVGEPAAIVEVLREEAVYSHDTWDYRLLRPLIGQGLLTATGEEWVRRRALVAPIMLSQAPRLMVAACRPALQRLRRAWEAACDRGVTIDLNQLLLEYTLSVVSRMLFGRDLSDPADEIGRALLQARDEIAGWRVLRMSLPLAAKRPQRALKRLESLIVSEIHARRAAAREDVLQRLVDVWPESPRADRELCDEALTVLITSQVSPAAVASWGAWLMAGRPEVARRLAEEWRAGGDDSDLSLERLPRLPYATAVYQETLRLYPAVWAIPRVVTTRASLAGVDVRRGTQVVVLPYAVQRSPRFWNEPDDFQPDRFLAARTLTEGTYLPFGLGARSCVGATATKLLVLAAWGALFADHQFTADPNRPIAANFAMTLQPRRGNWGQVTRRDESPTGP